MDTLVPGCKGVISVEQLDSIPIDRYIRAMEGLMIASKLGVTPDDEEHHNGRDEL